MGLFELQSLVCRDELRAVCLRAASEDMLFPATSATSRSTVPRTFRSGFILSCLRSPSKLLRRPSSSPFGDMSCLGLFPHRGVLEGVHSCASVPALAMFRPRVFATPRRFTPPCHFAGLFHPAATSRVDPFRAVQGFVPVSWGSRLVAATLPPCRWCSLTHRSVSCHC